MNSIVVGIGFLAIGGGLTYGLKLIADRWNPNPVIDENEQMTLSTGVSDYAAEPETELEFSKNTACCQRAIFLSESIGRYNAATQVLLCCWKQDDPPGSRLFKLIREGKNKFSEEMIVENCDPQDVMMTNGAFLRYASQRMKTTVLIAESRLFTQELDPKDDTISFEQLSSIFSKEWAEQPSNSR